MEKLISFKSEQYKKIVWSTLFNSAAVAVSPNKIPFGIGNNSKFVITGNFTADKNTILVCQPDDSLVNMDIKKLNRIDCSFHKKDVFLFKMPDYINNKLFISNLYLNFHNQLVYQLYRACKSILIYTYEHLSNRYYTNKSIVKIETVESLFADIIVQLNHISPFILKIKTLDELNFLLDHLLDIITNLSRLSGARAILSGNALDLAFYVRLFQHFIAR